MSEPRIIPIDAPYPPDIATAFSRIMPPGIEPLKLFRTMARNPRVLQRMFAGSLLDKGSIGLRDRELMILRTCARCNSEYEWGVHVAFFAEQAELDQAQIAATLSPAIDETFWPARDALILRLADALHNDAGVSDSLWSRLAEHFAPEQLLELITLAGYYHTISFMTNALRIDTETYAARFADFRK